jgi:leader peptidase (prepilin peptidase) / N-methyltransferase
MDSPELWLIGFLIFILGASVGSFLNVVIYRVPEGLSLLHPPSRCPQCKTRLRFYDNVPILGWLWPQLRFCLF